MRKRMTLNLDWCESIVVRKSYKSLDHDDGNLSTVVLSLQVRSTSNTVERVNYSEHHVGRIVRYVNGVSM